MKWNVRRSKPFINSIRFKLITGLIVIMLPVVMYLIYNNVYSINVVRNQVAASIGNTVNLYMDIVDSNLDSLEAYLFRLILEEDGFMPLETEITKDQDGYKLEKIRVFTKMYEDMRYYESLDFTYIYNAVNNELMFIPNEYKQRLDIPDWTGVSNSLTEYIHPRSLGSEFENSWFDVKLGEDYYIMRLIKSGELFIGMGIQIDRLLGPKYLFDLGEGGRAVFTNERNEPLLADRFFVENDIELAYQDNDYRLTGANRDYLIVGQTSSKGSFQLVALVPDDVILEQLPYLLRITYLIAIAAIAIVGFALVALRKGVLLPVHRIVSAMQKVRSGYLDARIPRSRTSNEFESINETFNNMVGEIQQLKIDIYEEQLVKQKAELRQLQLQINPHFFLNSLNIVYYLAMDKKFSLIQELSLSLIQYFRFMFQSGAEFVALQDEIKHTVNYLRIQTFRFPGNLSYDIDVPEDLLSVSLPPLVIQTFVENTIKYAMDIDRKTDIFIQVRQSSSNSMHIVVKDTGPGFSKEMLEKLQQNINLVSEQGEKIGIWNVRRRLELLYNAQTSIRFSNQNGAVVEIILPMNRM